jgi:hypothetical protein
LPSFETAGWLESPFAFAGLISSVDDVARERAKMLTTPLLSAVCSVSDVDLKTTNLPSPEIAGS